MDDIGTRNEDDPRSSDHAVQVLEPVAEASPVRRKNRLESGPLPALKPPMGILAATVFGMVAAVMYTAANIALRQCVDVDPFLVSAVKAAPTVIVLGPFLAWMLVRRETIATSYKMVPRFIAASLLGQFVGNAAFQVSLGVIGLAASVPITLGVLIIGGAILGRVILHEPVRLRTILAMITLIAAVIVLSLPDATVKPAQSTSTLPIWVGALARPRQEPPMRCSV